MARLWLAVLLLLAACEHLPQPFRHDPTVEAEPLSLMPSGVGVVVNPFSGVPEPTATALAEAMVRALRQADIFAVTAANDAEPLRYTLQTSVRESARKGDRLRLVIQWRVVGSDLMGGTGETSLDVAEARWLAAEPASIEQAVAEPASRLAAWINEDPGQAIEPKVPQKVIVLPVLGLPADGNAALTAAMETTLRHAGLEVQSYSPDIMEKVGGKAGTALLIEGRITLTPLSSLPARKAPGKLLKVVWTVKQADGVSLGSIAQQNETPLAMLKSPWGPLATAIAQGGAEGVSAFTQRGPINQGPINQGPINQGRRPPP